ncbi:RHS repeat-associated core domain-containing protein [Crossiella sp. CA198]|uniref:RHS repeat-associated core domain-containing protein n=1 Tax=Crossiella sp. CA198 TaxID=3455607 RepID=UPI003F8D3325
MGRRTLFRRATCVALGLVLFSTTVSAVAAPAAAPGQGVRPELQKDVSIPGGPVSVRPLPHSESDKKLVKSLPKPTWPANGAAEVVLPSATPPQGRAAEPQSSGIEHRKAGSLPVAIGLVQRNQQARSAVESKVKVETFDQKATEKAGLNGVLLKVTDAGGAAGSTVSVQVDYGGFADAFGGDYGTRLRLVQLPGCVLSTPEKRECRVATPVRTDNHAGDRKVTAQVPLDQSTVEGRSTGAAAGGSVLAATAAPKGSAGTYEATSLAPSGSWSAGSSSGDFGYSLPIRVPPAIGGASPQVTLGYSSGSLDGRTSATNNQSSWAGDGWDLSPGGFIERRYKSCFEDKGGNQGNRETGDSCWVEDNATLVLGGTSSELVKDEANNRWRPKKDDGSYVELLKGTTNGDNDGEHWKVTTTDGTQFFLGLNRLPGWTQGKDETNSTWTTPVYGNHDKEPCHVRNSYPESFCQQAWRWNLDYVVDRLGNVTTYYYDTEINHYSRNMSLDAPTKYVRAGNINRIEYGLRAGGVYQDAPMRIRFESAERCVPEGAVTCDPGQLNKDTAKSWPDVPFEQICDPGKECTGNYAPSFFSRTRLAKIVTELRKDNATGPQDYRQVDSWTLRHTFPAAGDGLAPALWLAGVTHTGHVEGTATKPEVKFGGTSKANRVDATEGIPPLTRYRLTSITGEAGGHTEVKYTNADCRRADRMPAKPESNTLRCYPIWWAPPGAVDPILDWFHKYVVEVVVDDDRTGGSRPVTTTYRYKDNDAAWHYDDNEFAKPEHRTWSSWRGHGEIRTISGDPGTTQSITDTFYLRGMDGDVQPGGGKRKVSVLDSEKRPTVDHDLVQGQVLEAIQYNDGKAVAGSINVPELKGPTATHGDDQSFIVNIGAVRHRTLLGDGTWRRTGTTTSFDKFGIAEMVEESGDLAVTGDERCTRTSYARNEGNWVLGLASRVHTVALPCAAGTGKAGDLVSDVRSRYDNKDFGVAVTSGLVTATERWDGTKYQQLTTTSYDTYGRSTEAVDVKGVRSRTSYSPAEDKPVKEITVTNPLGHQKKRILEPAWGTPVAEIGANGERSDLKHDPLGRVVKVWTPIRSKMANPDKPSTEFSYELRTDAPTVVTTKAIRENGSYSESYKLYDGLLRERQAQHQATATGRIITDTWHDSRGLVVRTNGAYHNEHPVSKALHGVKDNLIPNQTTTEYDGLGRVTASVQRKHDEPLWQTTTRYEGDRTHVTPPAGGVATTVISDARGQIVERRQYHGGQPTGGYDAMTYGYTTFGELTKVTDAAGNVWEHKFDQLGRKTEDHDPDRGRTIYRYDQYDRLASTTDARQKTLSYRYDDVNRKRALHEETASGPVLQAEWTYDTLKKGLPTSSARYIGGQAYTTRVGKYDDTGRPLSTVVNIPAQEGKLAGDYTFRTEYKPVTGQVGATILPEAGGLPLERITHSYNDIGMPTETSGINTYAQEHLYTAFGETRGVTLGEGTNVAFLTNFYDPSTHRLERSVLDRNAKPGSRMADRNYTYDPVGNITRIADVPEGGKWDTQCFRYDHLRRMTKAFTPGTGDCRTDPRQVGELGGAAPYWSDFSYDVVGNRTSEIQHTAQGPVTRRFQHPDRTKPQPHTVRGVTREGPNGTAKDEFTYDATGNTVTRKVSGSLQTMDWTAEGRLAKVTEADGKSSTYEYGPDGGRLLKREPGRTTLYLPGTELSLPDNGEVTAKRYYSHGGATVAVRGSVSGLSLMFNDHQGTSGVSVNATTLAVDKRYQDPFGIPRGAEPGSWPDDKGFVGGTRDATGLTHIGAREYDASLGRFISVDPLMDLADPQQMHGYSYANGNPVTFSDPSGLAMDCRPNCYENGVNHNVVTPPGVSRDQRVAGENTRIARSQRNARYRPGDAAPSPSPSPKKIRMMVYKPKPETFWDHTLDFVEGVGEVAVNAIQGVYAVATAAADCSMGAGSGSVAAIGGTTCSQMAEGVVAMIEDPGKVIDTMIEPFKMAWENGEYGRLAGLTVGTVAEVILGTRGLGPAVKTLDTAADAAASAGKRTKPPCHSFVPGTLVLLADGTTRAIEELVLGDTVLATDPETGRTEAREVVATLTSAGLKNLVEITVDTDGPSGDAVGTVVATDKHPFWVADERLWRDADMLLPGDDVLTAQGDRLPVVRVVHRVQIQRVHNLTIAGIHTYFVLAGTTAILSHNANEFCNKAGDLGNLQKSHGLDPEAAADMSKLSNKELIESFNNPLDGDRVLVTRDGKLLGGHHRVNELQKRVADGRIDPNESIRIEVFDSSKHDGGW